MPIDEPGVFCYLGDPRDVLRREGRRTITRTRSVPAAVLLSLVLCAALGAVGCRSKPLPRPDEIICPPPIQGNTGKYVCAYTTDDVLAEWVDKAVAAKFGASLGGAIGAIAGREALKQIPFVGGILGAQAGKAIGREVAIKASGGWDFIRETSDLSFNSLGQLGVYLYVHYSTGPHSQHYQDACKALDGIYPGFLAEQY
jgi:hypothetical protein